MLADQLVHGHADLADWLYLIAAILFGVCAFIQRTDTPAMLALIGWCLLAVGFLVL